MSHKFEAPEAVKAAGKDNAELASNKEISSIWSRSDHGISSLNSHKKDSASTSIDENNIFDMGTDTLYSSTSSHIGVKLASLEKTTKSDATKESVSDKESSKDIHKVKAGETLESISKKHLGENASENMISGYKTALRLLNNINDGNEPKEGKELKIPQKLQDGAFIYNSKDLFVKVNNEDGSYFKRTPELIIKSTPEYHKTIKTKSFDVVLVDKKSGSVTTKTGTTELTLNLDGSKRLKRGKGTDLKFEADGTVTGKQKIDSINGEFTRTKDDKGGFIDKHTGTRPENNFTLVENEEGELSVKDAGSEKVMTLTKGDTNLDTARTNLLELAEKRIDHLNPAMLSRFKANMVRFEDRAREKGLPDKEVTDTYKNIAKLLRDDDKAKVPLEDRTKIAQQILMQAARPSVVDQGTRGTCTVATMEGILYREKPSLVADVVASVALTSEYVAQDGVKTYITSKNLKPDSYARVHPTSDLGRSFASQIFQTSAINIKYADEDIRYRAYPNEPESLYHKLGPRITDKSGNPLDAPNFSLTKVNETYKRLTGKSLEDRLLSHKDFEDETGVSFDSEAEMVDVLKRLKLENKLPAVMLVSLNNENSPALKTYTGPLSDKTSHVILISDIDIKNNKISIDNQWGHKSDYSLTPAELYKSTRKNHNN